VRPGFPLYFRGEIQGLFKDPKGMDSITATFNICFCDYGTVFVDKNKT